MLSLFFHLLCSLNFTLSSTFSLPYQRKLSAGTKKNLHSYYFVPSDLISTIQQKLRIVGNFMGVSLLRACSICASLSFLRGWHPAPPINIITQAGCHPHHLWCYCHVRQDSLNSYDYRSHGIAYDRVFAIGDQVNLRMGALLLIFLTASVMFGV